ncbi:hypothetical protein C8N47_10377 [Mangrovibacterium marinum]|uniref:Uncharacterized protein n=1 Tax=Mangrovibacterium marinum TaxID=1639118 RepID=A0A2T5C4M4_9BACT|nr:hypothetical protein C8N47_10377 [Mangrovibacterium marinum]
MPDAGISFGLTEVVIRFAAFNRLGRGAAMFMLQIGLLQN